MDLSRTSSLRPACDMGLGFQYRRHIQRDKRYPRSHDGHAVFISITPREGPRGLHEDKVTASLGGCSRSAGLTFPLVSQKTSDHDPPLPVTAIGELYQSINSRLHLSRAPFRLDGLARLSI